MKDVHIKENSWLAKIAAKRLGFAKVAFVLGNTIHLHNTPIGDFVNDRRWLLHELKHVEQFERGFLKFLRQYLMEHIKNGYYKNRFEVEARNAETDTTLLYKYNIARYLNP